jgi:broad specificity phosphatase PhoE
MPVLRQPQEPSLVLIRHAPPKIDSTIPASEWTLSQEGKIHCESFANRLKSFHPTIVYHSQEPKAAQTAEIVANSMNLSYQSHPNLHEHNRQNYKFLSQHEFERDVQRFFSNPVEVAFGLESADAVYQRFSSAVMEILQAEDQKGSNDIFIVSHGTAMSLFTARNSGVDPFSIWKQLTMPSAVVLNRVNFSYKNLITGSFRIQATPGSTHPHPD